MLNSDELRTATRDLYDLAVNDWTGLWEVARTVDVRFPSLTAAQRAEVGALVARQLIDVGCELYFAAWREQEFTPIPRVDYETVHSDPKSWTIEGDPLVWINGEEPSGSERWRAIHDSF